MSYNQYLKNRSVAIVGPAPSVLEVENNREIIEASDLIVRLNRALPINSDLTGKIGSRTNILYNCLDEDPESGGYLHIPYLVQEIDWLVSPYPERPPFKGNIDRLRYRNGNRINFEIFNSHYYRHLEESMGTRPNTGVLTILDLLSRDIKSLYITGFTFFKGGYIKEYRDYTEKQVLNRMKAHGNHKQEPQFQYLKNILLKDERVTNDKFLLDILNGDSL